jgi:hypothetical protein
LKAIGDRAQDAEANVLGFRVADESERLIDELQIKTWICRHLIQLGLLGLLVNRNM